MDKLLVRRKPVRSSFTKCYNLLMNLLTDQANENEIRIRFATLERLYGELSGYDDEIVSKLLDSDDKTDDDYEAEYIAVEQYKEKMDGARVEVGMFLSKLTARTDRNMSTCSSPTSSKKLKLPKIELKKFGGEVKEWLSFWSQFKRIHEDQQIENEDKFQYLIQATLEGTRAREVVDSFPPTAENYPKVICCLQDRFGREGLLIEFYVRELLRLVVDNATNRQNNVDTVRLYDKLESHLRSLESIGMTSDKYAAMLFPLVESCIPEDMLRVWLRNPVSNGSGEGEQGNIYSKKLKHLLSFLKNEVEGEERICLAKTGFHLHGDNNKQEKRKLKKQESVITASELFSGEVKTKQKLNCVFCERTHESKECFIAQKMSLEKKQDVLKASKRCFICFKTGHRAEDCKASVRCLICSKKHWPIMCPDLLRNQEKQKTSEVEEQCKDEKQSSILSSHCQKGNVLLQTLLVRLESRKKTRIVRAIIDCGSQRSYILASTATEMGYKVAGSEKLAHNLFGGITSKKIKHNCYNIQLKSLKGDYSCNVEVLDQPVICGNVNRISNTSPHLKTLAGKNIVLTDVGEDEPPIELLLGADVAGTLYSGEKINLSSGLVALHTFLGWVLMGRTAGMLSSTDQIAMTTTLLTHLPSISDLWKLDVLGIADPVESKTRSQEEAIILDHFQKTLKKLDGGRYEVKLPWKDNRVELPDNRSVAEKRLYSTTAKLIHLAKFNDYDAVLQNWKREGIIEEVPEQMTESVNCHYLPHRAVFKDSATTPVRPVFDASCKSRGFLSLNDCLSNGPNFLESIPSLLLKFRERYIGVTADIRQAFLQISIEEEDRDYLRFLWWRNYSERKMVVFKHCRVVFGVKCSPFLLEAVLNHHLTVQHSSSVKTIAEKLKNSFYVDNCVISVDNSEELHHFMEEATRLMANAKFDLRNWEYTKMMETTFKPTSILGLKWDKQTDCLFCDTSNIKISSEILTRKTLLSITQQVFDPIGFSCPVSLFPKILLQESWRSNVSWDAEVPDETGKRFRKWLEELPQLREVKIPRYVSLRKAKTYDLHVFCDASRLAYAAVVFLRCQDDETVSVQLLQAKARVAPLKSLTIPRLELLACCIGARLAASVKKGFSFEVCKEYYWTDSTTALCWLQRAECWSTFISNRVKEILSLTRSEAWHHIPGRDNPADLPSRGCSVKKLLESRWWDGPEWLKKEEDTWPKTDSPVNEMEVNMEKKCNVVTALVDVANQEAWYCRYFSKYSKILRMVAWILRFIDNARKKFRRTNQTLTVEELRRAEKLLVKDIQQEVFACKQTSDLKTLNVQKDDEGILRVKTKISERPDIEDFLHPMLLPNKHKLVELIVQEEHISMSHAGVSTLLTKLRNRFWIVKGRRTIKRIISKCIPCKRHEAKAIRRTPVPLPEDRVKDAAIFEITGVDLAGPLWLKDGRKSWIVLFTCAVYRAVHLELVTSLSTRDFLLALRRFISRRGRPKIIYSDNGTNFVGTNNLFNSINWKEIEHETAVVRIQWKFNPPTAAWWGGWWERLIQVVKKLLRRILGRAALNYEELLTMLYECEAVVNSRPLTYVSEDPRDLQPLTPAMFLQENTKVGVPDLDHLDKVDLKKRIRYLQRLREDLKNRFRAEYLSQLLQPPGKVQDPVRVGNIVLVENENKGRIFWPLAKVIKVYPGKDGKVSVVRVKSAAGEFIRPVQRIFPLELTTTTSEDIRSKVDSRNGVKHLPPTSPDRPIVTRRGRTVRTPQRLKD